jgi:hypothetical protein
MVLINHPLFFIPDKGSSIMEIEFAFAIQLDSSKSNIVLSRVNYLFMFEISELIIDQILKVHLSAEQLYLCNAIFCEE